MEGNIVKRNSGNGECTNGGRVKNLWLFELERINDLDLGLV